jgi:HKD family nuclease
MSILAETEFLILPYASKAGRSLLHVLVDELTSRRWQCFRGAVAFAKHSGNQETLLTALCDFAREGGYVTLTVGADVFGGTSRGSDYSAVELLVNALEPFNSAKVFLYREQTRTFHPKVYLFSNEATQRARVIVGSSNWSAGGLVENVEANVIVNLDLGMPDHLESFRSLKDVFDRYWTEEEIS